MHRAGRAAAVTPTTSAAAVMLGGSREGGGEKGSACERCDNGFQVDLSL
jgi:hypothetical protein